MLRAILALSLLIRSIQAETVLGRAATDPAVYDCPPRQTIENAYLDYCKTVARLERELVLIYQVRVAVPPGNL
jgi:hypothetical protein